MSDDIIELIEDAPPPSAGPANTWAIAVIDDDQAVHDGTRFALFDYTLEGQGLEILSAYSAAEGRALIEARPDIAVIFLDVVMETDDAGLELVNHIRRTLKNDIVRIVLRTGQPGQAPERSVIVDYDINDYKAKTELTADKLFTALTAALRSYQQLQRLGATRRGLEIIIEAASSLFDLRSMQRLAEGVLTQIASLLNVDCAGILVLRDGGRPDREFFVLAGSGCYQRFAATADRSDLDPELREMVRDALARRSHAFDDYRSVLYIRTGSGREIVVLLESPKALSDTDRALVELFSSRLSVAFDNVILYQELQDVNARLEERVFQRTAELTIANQRLAAQRADLRRANQLKSEILGTVAHDLKNPLGVILGRAEMLADLLESPSAVRDAMQAQVEHIRSSARRLTAMVDALITDAMNDALDITIRHEPVDCAALAAEVVGANVPLADRKTQVLRLEAAQPVTIMGDGDRLREAVDNLVSNAVKYSILGGEIVVAVDRRGDEAVISVVDAGPGLQPEDIARLFARFQRLSAKPTGGEGSTGLGLSIVKRIAELHGGRVTAESPGAGRGSTFRLHLPMGETSEAP